MDAFGGEAGERGSLSSWNSDIGIPIIFKKSQASSPFEALISVCLSSFQSDMIPPVQMRWSPMSFPRVSTGDADMPSSCKMKDKPEFQPFQGYPAIF